MTLAMLEAINWHNATHGNGAFSLVAVAIHLGISAFIVRTSIQSWQRHMKWDFSLGDDEFLVFEFK